MKEGLELYIHIPFCEKKCNYCDFLSFATGGKESSLELMASYIRQLCAEISTVSKRNAASLFTIPAEDSDAGKSASDYEKAYLDGFAQGPGAGLPHGIGSPLRAGASSEVSQEWETELSHPSDMVNEAASITVPSGAQVSQESFGEEAMPGSQAALAQGKIAGGNASGSMEAGAASGSQGASPGSGKEGTEAASGAIKDAGLSQSAHAISGIVGDIPVSSVFIGGGTPSLLSEEMISSLLRSVRENFRILPDAEITMECNPASAIQERLAAAREGGVNRLSIGLQSVLNSELHELGRVHIFGDFLKMYQIARMEGFNNINIDLMNGIPGQTDSTWKKTLKNVIMLKPEHLSIYNLIVEERTPFFERQKNGRLVLPDEETMAEIDALTKSITERSGYLRYEVSNYARKGYECRHNLGYWSGIPYIGFGLGASSYLGDVRFSNISNLNDYLSLDMAEEAGSGFRTLRKDIMRLSRKNRMEEFMFLGLRKTEGISEQDFQENFSVDVADIYGESLRRFVKDGLMLHDRGHYRFTERGMDVSNILLAEFLQE